MICAGWRNESATKDVKALMLLRPYRRVAPSSALARIGPARLLPSIQSIRCWDSTPQLLDRHSAENPKAVGFQTNVLVLKKPSKLIRTTLLTRTLKRRSKAR